MTISSDIRTAGPFIGTGAVSVYSFAFKVFLASEVVVTSTDADGVLSTLSQPVDYTVALNADQNVSPGGTITLADPLPSGHELEIGSEIEAVQGASLPNQGGWYPRVIEDALDRLTILLQQVGGGASNRNLRAPELGGVDPLPAIAERAGKLLSFDSLTGAPKAVAPADQSATSLAVILASTSGPRSIGFDWAIAYEQDTVGAAIRQASGGVNVLRWITPSLWVGLLAGTETSDVITAAVTSAKAAAGSGGTIIIPAGTYYTSTGLDLTGFSGRVLCAGTIKASPSTAIAHLVDLSTASGFEWHGGALDFSQSTTTVDGDARSDHGFYMLDARDGKIHGVEFRSIRIGEVVYINGTSSVSPGASHGSKRIQVWGCSCVAFAPPSVDVGAAVYIRSDFYTSDGGGTYMAATNGLKVSDYTLDAAVAYQRTTTDIQFWGNRFENFDGFRLFNVARVTCNNQQLINFYTRGYTLSPSCEDVQVTGGIVSGNAAHINVNYACKRCSFSDLIAQGEQVVAGQRHTLRVGFGSENVSFSNIVGFGSDTRHVMIEGAKRVTFTGVNLRNWTGGPTTIAVSVAGGGIGNTSSWVTDDIKFIGCTFQANYGLKFDDYAGTTATVADGAVVCDESTRFDYATGLFQGSGYSGKVSLHTSGLWTPILRGASTAGAHTYSTQYGKRWIKGNMVHYTATIALSSKDAAMAGSVQIAGLLEAAANVANQFAPATIAYDGSITYTGYSRLGGAVLPNTAYVSLYKCGSGSAVATLAAGDIASTSQISVSGWYYL